MQYLSCFIPFLLLKLSLLVIIFMFKLVANLIMLCYIILLISYNIFVLQPIFAILYYTQYHVP